MIAIQFGVIIFLLFVFIIIALDGRKKKELAKKRAKAHRFWKNGINGKGHERRQSIRIDTDIDVLYEIVFDNDKVQKHFSMARNISAGGVNLALDEKLLPETFLKLQLNIPEWNHPIVTEGKIVWVKEISERFINQKQERYFATGIKFTEMSSHDQSLLNDFISHHAEGKKKL